ncbi:MAG: hypothetical protein IPM42_07985 [Saprospiraceae bacterium]|nr:hypothetical protein [Saprospiraceae bacterium]
MLRYVILIYILIYFNSTLQSQDAIFDEVKHSDISIPSAPAFALLGVNPETVLRPSDLRSFKVDWRIKNYNLAPDLALEAQPLWHFYYKKKSFDEYARASGFAKKLSTLSLSLGTAKIDGINHAAYSIKVNLFKKDDPIDDTVLLKEIGASHEKQIVNINYRIDSLIVVRYESTNPSEKEQCDKELELLRYEKVLIHENSKTKYREIIEQHNGENWNRTMLDFAFGRVYTYDNGSIDSLKVRSAGMSIWVNGCLKAGKNGLVTGIFKYSKVFDSSNNLLGISYRYGSLKYNFYLETVYESLGNYYDPNQDAVFDEGETLAGKFAEDLGSGWLDFNNTSRTKQYTIAYGGDFRLSKNILLNFALRTQFSNDMKLSRLLPVANVVCLMK